MLRAFAALLLCACASAQTARISGPLKVSGDSVWFQGADGRPVVLAGSQTWNTLQDWGSGGSPQTLDFDGFVQFLKEHGHNFTLLWYTELPSFCGLPSTAGAPTVLTAAPHPWRRTGPGKAADGGLKFDLTKFDESFFDRLRARAKALDQAGIYAGVYLFSGEWLNVYRCPGDGYPFTGANNINGVDDGYKTGPQGVGSIAMTAANAITALQDAYVEKVIDTLNDLPNVLWIVSEEAPANSVWWNDRQIAHIRKYEAKKPRRHPIGYAALAGAPDSILYNSDADWVAPQARISRPGRKVTVNDSDHSYWEMWKDTPQQNRNYAWQNFASGSHVLFMDPYLLYYPRESRNLCASPRHAICAAPDPRWDNFRDTLGYIVRYSRKLNLAEVRPHAALASTGYCLAQTPAAGAEYLVYAPSGGSFTVDLSAMPDTRRLKVEWFNQSTGAILAGKTIPAGSPTQHFEPPFAGDAVLYLTDAAGHR